MDDILILEYTILWVWCWWHCCSAGTLKKKTCLIWPEKFVCFPGCRVEQTPGENINSKEKERWNKLLPRTCFCANVGQGVTVSQVWACTAGEILTFYKTLACSSLRIIEVKRCWLSFWFCQIIIQSPNIPLPPWYYTHFWGWGQIALLFWHG